MLQLFVPELVSASQPVLSSKDTRSFGSGVKLAPVSISVKNHVTRNIIISLLASGDRKALIESRISFIDVHSFKPRRRFLDVIHVVLLLLHHAIQRLGSTFLVIILVSVGRAVIRTGIKFSSDSIQKLERVTWLDRINCTCVIWHPVYLLWSKAHWHVENVVPVNWIGEAYVGRLRMQI